MDTYYNVEGRDFIPGEKDKAIRYAKELANREGRNITVEIETGTVIRDPSGFVYDFQASKRSKRVVKPDKKSNPARPLEVKLYRIGGRNSTATVKAYNATEARAKARKYGWSGKFKVTVIKTVERHVNPAIPKDKWIKAKAVKFCRDGRVQVKK